MITSIRLDEDTKKMIDEMIEISEQKIPGLKITKTDIIKLSIMKSWHEMKINLRKEKNETNRQ